MLVLLSSNLLLWWVRSFLVDKLLQLSLSDKSFYLLLQVIAVKCVIVVVMVKAAVLVFGPLIGVSLQFVGGNVTAPSFLICIKTWLTGQSVR